MVKEKQIEKLKIKLLEKIEHHQRLECMGRIYKQGTISYHKTKSKTCQEILAIIES